MPEVRAVRADPEVLGRAAHEVPDLRSRGPEAPLRARHPVQGHGLVHHRLRAQVAGGAAPASRKGRAGSRTAAKSEGGKSEGGKSKAAKREGSASPKAAVGRREGSSESVVRRQGRVRRPRRQRHQGQPAAAAREQPSRASATSGTRGRRRPGPRASARTPPWPSGSRACCRRRGATPSKR